MKYNSEQFQYLLDRVDKHTELGDRCVWCLQDTSFGSGKYVNRIDVLGDAEATDWYEYLNPTQQALADSVSGYGCEECYNDEKISGVEVTMLNFTCEECGASGEPKAKNCCDECVLKFYTEDINAPSLNEIDGR